MITPNLVPLGAEPPQKSDMTTGCGPQGPMSQQDAGSHGHEMHPQKFLRLVGCHESGAGTHGEARRLH
jgi:hypothetical protein